jgi:hypothetical protein
MRTNDVILFGLGLIAGYFFKSNWDKKNTLIQASMAGMNCSDSEANLVFSQKYKDCEAEATAFMSMSKFAQNTDLEAFKKNRISECMKKA